MPPTSSVITFTGINSIMSAEFPFAHGISPSVASMTILPQEDDFPTSGKLRIVYGQSSIEFDDCLIDSGAYQRNKEGFIIGLQVFDRRWKWQFGEISGRYNVTMGDGAIIDATKKSVQELATLCLDAMGETDYDASALPSDPSPQIEWDGEVPAEALNRLCDEFGYRVVLQIQTGQVVICKDGEGEQITNTNAMEYGITIDPPEAPSSATIRCGKTRYQIDMELEAVGKETDGTFQPVDDLSYKPENGWSVADVPDFKTIKDIKTRELARQHIWRSYRIMMPFDIPSYGSVASMFNCSIEDEQCETEDRKETVNGQEVTVKASKAAIVYGVWWPGLTMKNIIEEVKQDKDSVEKSTYRRGFSIDRAQGIVKFSEPVYMNDIDEEAGNKLTPAEADLRLRTAVTVRDDETGAWDRYEKSKNINQNAETEPKVIKHDELTLNVINDPDGGGDSDNKSDIDQACDYYLDATAVAYEVKAPSHAKYIGLAPYDLDGAILSVVFSLSTDGFYTIVTRNTEHKTYIKPYRTKQQQIANKQVARDWENANRLQRLSNSILRSINSQVDK